MRWIAGTAIAVLLVFCVGCFPIEGFSSANPRTGFMVRTPAGKAVEFADNKDNDVSVEEVEYNPQTGAFRIKNLKIINQASPVRLANVQQTAAWVPLAQANWQGLTAFTTATFNGLSDLATSLTPLQMSRVLKSIPTQKTVSTPWGEVVSQPGITADQVLALMEKSQANTAASPAPPTTEPPGPTPQPPSGPPASGPSPGALVEPSDPADPFAP